VSLEHHRHDHSYGAGLGGAGERHRRPLAIAFGLTATVMAVEVAAALWTNSLALLSDAAHMFTDVVGLGVGLAAISLAMRFAVKAGSAGSRHTFGLYRLEILAALVNSLALSVVAVFVLVEATRRLVSSQPVEILATPMLVVAMLGLVVNVLAFWLLRPGASESLNIEGAYLEVVADTIGSVGVIVAAVAIQILGWAWIDPAVGIGIGLWILPRTWRLARRAVRILLQSAPDHIDVGGVVADLASIEGVIDVHDIHVWTLTSQMDAVSAHLMTDEGVDSHRVLDQARDLLESRYGVAHATFQVEPSSHIGCQQLSW